MIQRPSIRVLSVLFAAGVAVSPAHGLGQDQASTANLTGTWEIAIEARGRLGRPEVLTLRQNADGTFTGAFIVESRRAEEPISDGQIDGDEFSFSRDGIQGSYEGTIDGDRFDGTLTQPSGNQVLTYSFVGARTSTDVISFAPPPPPPSAQVPTPGDDAAAAPVPTPGGDTASLPSSLANLPTPQPGKGILVLDGVTHALRVTGCTVYGRGALSITVWTQFEGGSATIRVIDRDGGSQQLILDMDGQAEFHADYERGASGAWTSNGAPVSGPLVVIDGRTVRASATTLDYSRAEHDVLVNVDCAQLASIGGGQTPASAQAPQPGTDPATPTPNAPTQAGAAPSNCMVGCVGEGAMTIEGETLFFTLTQCTVTGRGGGNWSGNGTSEHGPVTVSMAIAWQPQPLHHHAQIILPDATYIANYAEEADGWTRETRDERGIFRVPAQGPLVTHEGAEVTARGMFRHRTAWTDHEIELRLVCEAA